MKTFWEIMQCIAFLGFGIPGGKDIKSTEHSFNEKIYIGGLKVYERTKNY